MEFVSGQCICDCVLDPWDSASGYEELELGCDHCKAYCRRCTTSFLLQVHSVSTHQKSKEA